MCGANQRLTDSELRATPFDLPLLLSLLAVLTLVPVTRGDGPPETVRIGIVRSFFRDIPQSQVGASTPAFQKLMQAQTGLPSEVASPTDTDELADKLMRGQLHLGIFQGVEFAWMCQKHPDLRPLVIAVNQHPNRQAHLLVRQDFPAANFAGLNGKTLAIPKRSREHCLLFVERQCQQLGREPAKFFSRIPTPDNIEEALDDVVDGTVQAAVVDGVGLECYKRRKPGRFAKLKELLKSELFPDTVVAYRQGALDEATVKRFREGLLKADKTATGRLLLMLWTLTAFQPVPPDFDRMLTDIAKAYPGRKEADTKREDGAKPSSTAPLRRR